MAADYVSKAGTATTVLSAADTPLNLAQGGFGDCLGRIVRLAATTKELLFGWPRGEPDRSEPDGLAPVVGCASAASVSVRHEECAQNQLLRVCLARQLPGYAGSKLWMSKSDFWP